MYGKIMICILFVLIFSGCVKTDQKQNLPILVIEQNGVKLYRVWDVTVGHYVWFTTPTGDTHWVIPGNEDTPERNEQVPGRR